MPSQLLSEADGEIFLIPLDGISDAVEIAAGGHSDECNLGINRFGDAWGNHACARTASGNVRCWLDNSFGQLGDGMPVVSAEEVAVLGREPTTVVGIMDAVEITAGSGHSCARLGSGAVTCWGSNGAGQLGDGTYVDRATPVPVVGLE